MTGFISGMYVTEGDLRGGKRGCRHVTGFYCRYVTGLISGMYVTGGDLRGKTGVVDM